MVLPFQTQCLDFGDAGGKKKETANYIMSGGKGKKNKCEIY
jgi:hypothetical protein